MTNLQKIIVSSVGLFALALPASAQEKPQFQDYFVECSSQGEQCNKPLRIRLPGGSDTWTVSLTASAQHCSDVQFAINRIEYTTGYGTSGSKRYPKRSRLVEIWRSTWLSAGATDSYSFTAGNNPAVFITAQGREGGCNHGTLASWGVSVGFNSGAN